MASKGKKADGDFVLESRHLVGVFFLLVVIFGVVFTLGYLLGRSQYDAPIRAAAVKAADVKQPPPPEPSPEAKAKLESEEGTPVKSDWDFYHAAEPKTAEDHLQPPKKAVVPPQSVSRIVGVPGKSAKAAVTAPGSANGQLIPKGSIMLQVAALQTESDALALAQALQQKKFPAFVITPGADKFYRVQVGPYADNQSATVARHDLEAKGFKSIVKR
jgi:cell division septation protein DedD